MVEGFERHPLERRNRSAPRLALPVGILVLVWGAWVAVRGMREGDALVAVGVAWFSLVLGLGGIGVGLANRGRKGRFRYLNAVVMTRAERAPIDSWVHVAPTRALPVPLLACLVLFAFGMAAVTAVAVLQLLGVMPRLNAHVSTGALVVALLGSALFCVVGAWLAWLNIARKWRNGGFGARPSGVALGECTLSVRVPGREAEIAWEHIVSVRPEVIGGRQPLGMIRIDVVPEARIPGGAQLLPVDGYAVPSAAVYSALRWYAAHPEARWELGRIEGQRRIEGWRRLALGLD